MFRSFFSFFIFFFFFFFFFQAEDGIRDTSVTGVQTCALPISVERAQRLVAAAARGGGGRDAGHGAQDPARGHQGAPLCAAGRRLLHAAALAGGVVRWPARSTSWRRHSATWGTSRRARPKPCAASRSSPRKTPATRRPCSRTSAPAPTC